MTKRTRIKGQTTTNHWFSWGLCHISNWFKSIHSYSFKMGTRLTVIPYLSELAPMASFN